MGFRKVDLDRWEFANEGFLKGQKHLLKTIKRRKPVPNFPNQIQSIGPSLEVGRRYSLDGEIDKLRKDKSVLMADVVKLRQAQQNTRAHVQIMEDRLQRTEQKQQQMIAFLARAVQNPEFIQQLSHQELQKKELEETITKKRRRPIDMRPNDIETPLEVDNAEASFKLEGGELQDFYGYDEVSELEGLAIDIHGFGKSKEVQEENQEREEIGDGGLNDEFWEELLNEGMTEENGRDDEDVKVLAERLGYLSSSSPK